MKNEFVSYEIALALKELGFKEDCFAMYRKIRSKTDESNEVSLHFFVKFNMIEDGDAKSALYQQAFRFFREQYRLEGAIYRLNFKWASQVFNIETSTYCFKHELFETYEEAEINSLQKMIKIVKNKSV